jgi:hypothetical protein
MLVAEQLYSTLDRNSFLNSISVQGRAELFVVVARGVHNAVGLLGSLSLLVVVGDRSFSGGKDYIFNVTAPQFR